MRTSGKIFNNTFSAYTEDNKIYGKLEYDVEDHNGDLYHAVIPKIKLPFDADSLDIDRQFCQFDFVRPRCTLSIGGFEFDVLAVPSNETYQKSASERNDAVRNREKAWIFSKNCF